MADIFFSYSTKDRDRVRPFHEALSALGFDVFWDQAVPAGTDWDTWIREKLVTSRVAVVFWSNASVQSPNVRHEANVARDNNKLVPVMLDELRVDQFPIGLFMTQAARLMSWTGAGDAPEWRDLLSQIEAKVTPLWAERKFVAYEAEIKREQKKREAAQAREDAADHQLAKEISGQGELRRDREKALNQTKEAYAELAGLKKALATTDEQKAELHGRIAQLERIGRNTRSLVPLWAVPATFAIALFVGGGFVYILHSVPLQTKLIEGAAAFDKQGLEQLEEKKAAVARQIDLERQLVDSQGKLADARAKLAGVQDKLETSELARGREAETKRRRPERTYCYETPANACWHAQGCQLEAGKCVPQ
jgi:hypothetical protein